MLKTLNQMFFTLFSCIFLMNVGIPTKPYKRHASELLLHLHMLHATTQQDPSVTDSNPTASYYIPGGALLNWLWGCLDQAP